MGIEDGGGSEEDGYQSGEWCKRWTRAGGHVGNPLQHRGHFIDGGSGESIKPCTFSLFMEYFEGDEG